MFHFPVSIHEKPDTSPSEFHYDKDNDAELAKELILQVRKVIGPFAAPKKIHVVQDLPKTRSGKVRTFVFHKSSAGETDIGHRSCVVSCVRLSRARVISSET